MQPGCSGRQSEQTVHVGWSPESQLGSPYIRSAPGWQEFHGISLLRWHHCPHLASLLSQSSLQLCRRWCLLWRTWIVPLQVLTREAGPGQDLSLHMPDKGLHELKQGLLPLWTQLGGRLSLRRGKDPAGRWRGTTPAEVTGQAGEQRTLKLERVTSQLRSTTRPLPPQTRCCGIGTCQYEQPKAVQSCWEMGSHRQGTLNRERGQHKVLTSSELSSCFIRCLSRGCTAGSRRYRTAWEMSR